MLPSVERVRRAVEDTRRGGVLAGDVGADVAARLRAPAPADGPVARYPEGRLWDALREVRDPELPVSVVDLGLIVDVRQQAEVAVVDLTYTAIGCPCAAFIREDVCERLLREPGIERVEVHEVWQPAWTRARMTARGREVLRLAGVAS